MLLVSAFKVRNPVEAFIQMKVNDLARSARRWGVCRMSHKPYSTLFVVTVPEAGQFARVFVLAWVAVWVTTVEDILNLKRCPFRHNRK